MRNLFTKKRSEGFTIIEVMIVLAIAGVIMLVVFLAVPSLQRSSRNTQAKNDAQNVAGAITESISLNNGKLPTNLAGTGTVTVTNDNNTSVKVNGSTTVSVVTTTPTASALDGAVQVILKKNCAGTATNRGAAVYYLTEASTNVASCVDV